MGKVSILEDFTAEEKMRINQLAGGEVESPSIEDMRLFARWESAKAVRSEKVRAEMKATEDYLESKKNDSKRIADASVEVLNAQVDLARARLKAVENGQV